MNAKDVIRGSLEAADRMLLTLVEDLKDGALLERTTATGGNHALWTLGHVLVSESRLVGKQVLGGEVSLPAGWEKCFGHGCTPTAEAGDYPTVDELLARRKEVRARTLETLEALSAAQLDEPVPAALFGTKGRALAFIATHQAFHAGQLAVVRHRLGRKPLMA